MSIHYVADCRPGTEFVMLEDGVACRACAMNTFRENQETPICVSCPLNTYTIQPGSLRCLTVPQIIELGRFGYTIGGILITCIPNMNKYFATVTL